MVPHVYKKKNKKRKKRNNEYCKHNEKYENIKKEKNQVKIQWLHIVSKNGNNS